jgi:hypothetical protein
VIAAMGDQDSTKYVNALGEELIRRGFTVTTRAGGMVSARNGAADPPSGDSLARAMSAGLIQPVMCGPREGDRELWWFWVWSGPTRDAPPDYEALCPADQIETAAEKIARVLAVPGAAEAEW